MLGVQFALQRGGGDNGRACGAAATAGRHCGAFRGGFRELSEARFDPGSPVAPAQGRRVNRSVVSRSPFQVAIQFRLPPAGPAPWKRQVGKSRFREGLE